MQKLNKDQIELVSGGCYQCSCNLYAYTAADCGIKCCAIPGVETWEAYGSAPVKPGIIKSVVDRGECGQQNTNQTAFPEDRYSTPPRYRTSAGFASQ